MSVLSRQWKPNGDAVRKSSTSPDENPVTTPNTFPLHAEKYSTQIIKKSGMAGKNKRFERIDVSKSAKQIKINREIKKERTISIFLTFDK